MGLLRISAALVLGLFVPSAAYATPSVSGHDTLPGLHRVGIARTPAPQVGGSLDLGYGYTEPLGADPGPHHRFEGNLGVSISPLRWAALSFNAHGRFDKHPEDARGPDDGLLFNQQLALRLSSELGEAWLMGIELSALFPGAEETSDVLEGISPSARALVGWSDGKWTVGTYLGYHLSRADQTADEPERLRRGDRIALGISEFDALMLGVGSSLQLEQLQLMAELTGDILVGDGGPALSESPTRVAAGARLALSEITALQILGVASLSERPDVSATSPLIPIEPRFTVLAGFRMTLPLTDPPPPPPEPVKPEKSEPESKPPPQKDPPKPEPPAQLQVKVTDAGGNPIPEAEIQLRIGDKTIELSHTERGIHKAETKESGQARLHIRAEGFKRVERPLELKRGGTVDETIELEHALPPGQLRGLIRSFGGKGIRATVTIAPLGIETKTDNEGYFKLDVPPGDYKVHIEADDYQKQMRDATVEEQGVTVLNVELRRKR